MLQCGPQTLNLLGKTKYIIMSEYNYNSLWEFLKAHPKNLWSLIIIWGAGIAGMLVTISDIESFDNGGVFLGVIAFLISIMFLGWYRVFDLYQKNRKHK